MNRRLRFNVFGHTLQVERHSQQWLVYVVGNEGKRRLAESVLISPETLERDIPKELADLCHEWATEEHPEVLRVD